MLFLLVTLRKNWESYPFANVPLPSPSFPFLEYLYVVLRGLDVLLVTSIVGL